MGPSPPGVSGAAAAGVVVIRSKHAIKEGIFIMQLHRGASNSKNVSFYD
jgi:hypothetical protein